MNAIRAAENVSLAAAVAEEISKKELPAQRLQEAQFFIRAFFARLADGDQSLHTPAEWAELVLDLLDFIRQRRPGRAAVRVINPASGHDGRSVVEVVTDDTPFLVDTVSMILSSELQLSLIHI
jgi:glutamate dehydrogenase